MKYENGSTFIEVILYVGLSTVILALISSFFLASLESEARSLASREVEEQGRNLTAFINRQLKQAVNITAPAGTNSANQIIYTTQNPATSPSIITITNERISLKEGLNPPVNLTGSLLVAENFIAYYSSIQKNLKIEFQLKFKNPDNRNILNYRQNFNTSITYK